MGGKAKRTQKLCNVCRTLLPLSAFYNCAKSPDFRGYTCRECHKLHHSQKQQETSLQKERRVARLKQKLEDPAYRALYLERKAIYRETERTKGRSKIYGATYRERHRHEEAYRIRIRAHSKARRLKHPEEMRAREQRKKHSLPDSYVRGALANSIKVPRSAIPQNLIELHRQLIQLKRAIREQL